MKELTFYNELKAITTNIETNHDSYMKRFRLTFRNGYGMSVIKGYGSYGGRQGCFEIAPIDKDKELDGNLIGIEDDDVLGWLTKEDVVKYAKQIANIKEVEQ